MLDYISFISPYRGNTVHKGTHNNPEFKGELLYSDIVAEVGDTMGEYTPQYDVCLDRAEFLKNLTLYFDALPAIQQYILIRYLGQGATFTTIAKEIKSTRWRVSMTVEKCAIDLRNAVYDH